MHLYGLLAHWHKLADSAWVESLLTGEETERAQRNLERRLGSAPICRFKPLADPSAQLRSGYNWNWPEQCDRTAISESLSLEFLKKAANAILVGASGLGKSTIAQNIAYQAVLHRHTVLFTTAGQLKHRNARNSALKNARQLSGAPHDNLPSAFRLNKRTRVSD